MSEKYFPDDCDEKCEHLHCYDYILGYICECKKLKSRIDIRRAYVKLPCPQEDKINE